MSDSREPCPPQSRREGRAALTRGPRGPVSPLGPYRVGERDKAEFRLEKEAWAGRREPGARRRGQRVTSTPAVSWSVGISRGEEAWVTGGLCCRRPTSPSPGPRALPESSGQTGQHSLGSTLAPGQFLVSSQITSSHKTSPLWQTQIWHGWGFHISPSLYRIPFCTQVTGGTGARTGGGVGGAVRGARDPRLGPSGRSSPFPFPACPSPCSPAPRQPR